MDKRNIVYIFNSLREGENISYSLLYPQCIIQFGAPDAPDKYLLHKLMFYSSARYMSHSVIEYQTSCLVVSPTSVINHLHDLEKRLTLSSYKMNGLD